MNFDKLNQYKKLGVFLYKYGTSDLVKMSGIADQLEEDWEEKAEKNDVLPENMVEDLIEMGPTFIKLGQLLSTRPDILPPPYIEALSRLQDNVKPFEYNKVEEIINEELGVKISKLYESFDKEPIASASIGQVHLATLRSGSKVVVKIQRPNIRKEILNELEVLESVASLLEKNTAFGKQFECEQLIQYFKKSLLKELNYLKEAEHMKILGKNLENYKHLVVPSPIDDYTTDKVLTMEYLKGKKITKISPLKKMDINGNELANELFKSYLQQIVIDGFMHADPHPGNIHLTNNDNIALLDLGMVAYIGVNARQKYLQLIILIGESKGEELANLLIEMSNEIDDANHENFKKEIILLVQENKHISIENMETGKLIFSILKSAGENGFLLPIELSFIGKVLLNLDQIAMTLAPKFNPQKSIQKYVTELMHKHLLKDIKPNNIFSTILESKEFLELLPKRLNKILQKTSEGELSLKVDAFDEKHLMRGFQKIANRITLGLILAALLIAAAMLMRVPSDFMLYGYPGLAIIAFVIAFVGSIFIAYQIFFKDE